VKKGHWAHECRGKLKGEDQAHVAQEEEEQALLLSVCVDSGEKGIDPHIEPPLEFTPAASPAAAPDGSLHFLENKVLATFDNAGDRDPTRWVLDTGASNHMTGSRAAFSNIDSGVTGTSASGMGQSPGSRGLALSCSPASPTSTGRCTTSTTSHG
jgi:hypothetical protein